MKKKIVSLILVFSFMLSLVSSFEFTFFVNAEEATTGGTAVLTVDQTWASAGDSVDVKVTITENPDILGATLTLSWDKNLTLTNAVSGDAFGYMDFTMPELIQASGTIFMWDCQRVKNATTGTVLTLTFTVSDNVKNNTVLPINVSCGDYDIFDKNENFVKTDITNGNVRTITYIPGDVNSDKAINVLDVIRLRQYISDGLKTDPDGYNAVVNEEACDITGDGRINVLDVIRLRQYISDGLKTDPEGYNVALLPAKLPECNHSDLKKTPKKAATCTEDGGQYYGALPTPVRANYTFIGWYTSSDGGNLITAETLVSSLVNLTLYAHWTPNSFNVYFDANGGTVSVSSKSATFGNSLGALPEPTRDYHNFTGWYDSANNRVYDSTIPSSAADITLYAHWELKPETTDWVKASELPTGAQVTSRKWSYTKTYYTTSGSSSLSGWTYYNVTSAWSDYGSWSAWQDGVVSESDSRQIETQEVVASANYKTVYHYYYYSKAETNGNTSYQPTTTYGTNRYTVSFDSELPTGGTVSGLTKYKWNNHHNSGYYMYVYKDDPYTTQEVVSYNYKTQYRYRDRTLVYTYYYYRTENLETSTYPNTDNMSNIVEWVKYRAK